ncbi:longitudinals lacking protein, isoforms H/M/V-like [Varroa jacobsoni]|uniref:BTB domain-containing protein n=1 Tax=Varroa destructor TaxID=109461 RepID=A0A7M7KLA4_VARDE|nr:longitudinals lacking protein, isoforms H/M/V-like [Varroa destructor]XP_022711424.1 longitudinals lacking protein, isoforms H/M/V-like [Varroa jacobsoni]
MGSNAQQFCLKWNNHQANMLAVFERLLGNKSLVDVTLGCEGRQMKAHKVVLSACSPFFEGLFTENPCKHPIVILKDIRYADLKALVEFMYKGEVNVVQEQLPTLLKTAEALKIKGLAEVTGESKDDSGGGSSNSQQQQARSAANATPRPESPNSGRRKRQRARRRSTDSAGAGDGLSDSEESVPKTSRTDLQDESSMDGASSHDDGSQASLQRASKKETAPVQTNVDSTSSPASASASAKNSRSAEQTTATNKSAANSNGQVPSSKDTGGGDFEPSRLLEASMTTDQGGDDSTDNLNNTTGPDNNSTNNELDIKPLITLDEGGATPTGAIVPASAAAAAALAGADALSSLFPQGASTAAALAGTSFQNSPPSHGTYCAASPASVFSRPSQVEPRCWALYAEPLGVG